MVSNIPAGKIPIYIKNEILKRGKTTIKMRYKCKSGLRKWLSSKE